MTDYYRKEIKEMLAITRERYKNHNPRKGSTDNRVFNHGVRAMCKIVIVELQDILKAGPR